MKKPFFYKLILEACTATFTKKLPWIFGSFMTIFVLIGNKFSTDITDTNSFEALFQTMSQKSPQELGYIFFIIFTLFIINAIGKGNLIVSLSFITNKNHLSNHPTTLRTLWKNFISTFILECIAFIFLIAIMGILSVPFFVASEIKPSAVSILLNFAIFTFIPIAIIVSLVKEIAFIYVLLSPLKIRSAIEASRTLLSRFAVRSFFFILLTLILTEIFTFCVNLVILEIIIFSEKISFPITKELVTLIASCVLFSWFTIFLQALWIAFFKSIARPKTDQILEKQEVTAERSVLPEIPPAQ